MKDFNFPFATDKVTNKPSVTLLFAYVSFLLSLGVIIYLTVKDVLAGSVGALMLFFGCLLMYRLRKLDSFSIDMDDRSISVNQKDKEDA
jgi:hypothetical protein